MTRTNFDGSWTGQPIYAKPRGSPLFTPVRNPIDRSGMCFRAKVYSQKNSRFVKCESLLEARRLTLFEFARDVVSYSEQPQKLSIRVSGRTRSYTPDFAVRWKDGADWLVEVKPFEVARAEEMQERFEAARFAAAVQGMRFLVMSEPHVDRPGFADIRRLVELRRRTRTENLGQDRYVTQEDVQTGVEELAGAFSQRGEMTLSFAMSLLDQYGRGRRRIESLLASRAVAWRIDETLCDSTLVHPFSESDDEQLFV